jgi:hypothetical protein
MKGTPQEKQMLPSKYLSRIFVVAPIVTIAIVITNTNSHPSNHDRPTGSFFME